MLEAAEACALQDTADGGGRYAGLTRNMLTGEAAAAECNDLLDGLIRRGLSQVLWPGRAVLKPRPALFFEPLNPLARGPRADTCGACGGLRRLPTQHRRHQPLSTNRRQSCILVNVHPVLLEETAVSQPQLPPSGPDGQPIERSQLVPHTSAGVLFFRTIRCITQLHRQ